MSEPLVVNGWRIYAHPLFLGQLDALFAEVEALKARDPSTYRSKNATKRLAAILKLAFQVIPDDPAHPEFRQGAALGEDRKHWFRAKFFQQYRLFYRFHTGSRIIVYAWVNDTATKRAYESRVVAYRVFARMLDCGRPPDSWDDLLRESRHADARFQQVRRQAGSAGDPRNTF